MKAKKSVNQFRASGEYLPPRFRDFHAQKELFKAIHRLVKVDEHDYCNGIAWTEGQCYTIDIFLWFMARYGYTLQQSRARVEFEDLEQVFKALNHERAEEFKKAIAELQSNSTLTRAENGDL